MTILEAVGNHLWQSTLFAALVALATLAFRRNRAAVRHSLWLMASIKFLAPFALFVSLGHATGLRAPAPVVHRELTVIVDTVGQPFTLVDAQPSPRTTKALWTAMTRTLPSIVAVIWMAGSLVLLTAWWIRWTRVAAIARQHAPTRDGRVLDLLRTIERRIGSTTPITLVASSAPLEPGVFGIVHPVLVWPLAIGDQLDEDQIVTILTHEVAHVRRHDNLAAAMHMIVEALFWFHPLVWWIGARLIDERERACDEAVLATGHEPEIYAETIVKSCRLFIESPLPCVAGVTGSDLAKRIERIMRHRDARRLAPWQKALLAAVVCGPIAAPIVVGATTAPRPRIRAEIRDARLALYRLRSADQTPAQFEVASIKPTAPDLTKVMIQMLPGGRFVATGVTVRQLIRNAYRLQDFQISGGPAWLGADRFDIVAKAEGDLGDPFQAEQRDGPSRGQLMVRALLADRFKLEVHTDTKDQAIYALMLARSDGPLGAELKPTTRDCGEPDSKDPRCGMRLLPGTIAAGGVTLGQLANTLSMLVGRVVRDRTGLSDHFDFTLRWTPDQIPQGFDKKASAIGLPPIDPDGASLFTAIREQLGLKLDSQRGPVDILVVDRAERPTEN
jgi:bla regulator protein blaR1